MTNSKFKFVIIAVIAMGLSLNSCGNKTKDGKENSESNAMQHSSEMMEGKDHSQMNHDNSDGHHNDEHQKKEMTGDGNGSVQILLKDYFNLKDALVADSETQAKEMGATLVKSLNNLDISNYTNPQKTELKEIIEDATEHAEHIAKSEIDHQREHFKTLSKDVTDIVAITGSESTLYEQFCPMYDGGSSWLSKSEDIKNPYYGSKMLTCGKVQKKIN